MIGRLRHRGPDGSGLYRDDHAALGHTRLAIIDTEGGAQPLCNEDETVWITFNGEIFNYVELGEELRRGGHRFRTRSDTEVIVHAWEEWGEQCFDPLQRPVGPRPVGSREQRLVLSRDRLGVRPLFFTRDRHRIAFASEVKALMADPALPRAFDPIGLDEVLTYWSTVAPRTVFAGIEQLEPGHVAVARPRRLPAPPLLEHRSSPTGTPSRGRTSRRTPPSCASASSRRPGCGSCAATCRWVRTSRVASTPRSPPR